MPPFSWSVNEKSGCMSKRLNDWIQSKRHWCLRYVDFWSIWIISIIPERTRARKKWTTNMLRVMDMKKTISFTCGIHFSTCFIHACMIVCSHFAFFSCDGCTDMLAHDISTMTHPNVLDTFWYSLLVVCCFCCSQFTIKNCQHLNQYIVLFVHLFLER